MDPFRKGLGRSGSSFGRFWVLPGRFWGVPNRSFFQHGCKMGSKRAWGSILGRFWKGLGRIWEDVEGLLEALGRFLWGRIWLGPRFADFWTSVSWKSPLNYFGSETPALPRQLAWRHNEYTMSKLSIRAFTKQNTIAIIQHAHRGWNPRAL